MVYSFSCFIKAYRQNLCLSQEHFCDGICSLRQYKRIEAGTSEPTIQMLTDLSAKYNCDFLIHYEKFNLPRYKDEKHFASKFNDALSSHDYEKLSALVKFVENEIESMSVDSQIHFYYAKALLNKKSLRGMDYALKGLRLEDSSFDVNHISSCKIHSNVGLCLINYMALSYKVSQNYDVAASLYKYIIPRVEECISSGSLHYQSRTFSFSFYTSIVANYCHLLSDTNDKRQALNCLNSSIDVIQDFGYIKYLSPLLFEKLKLLYALSKFDEAEQVFQLLKSCCILSNNTDYFTEIEKSIPSLFPNLSLVCP